MDLILASFNTFKTDVSIVLGYFISFDFCSLSDRRVAATALQQGYVLTYLSIFHSTGTKNPKSKQTTLPT